MWIMSNNKKKYWIWYKTNRYKTVLLLDGVPKVTIHLKNGKFSNKK